MLKADASASAAAPAPGAGAPPGGGAVAAAEAAAGRAHGSSAAGEAFGALASGAALPWGGALSPGAPHYSCGHAGAAAPPASLAAAPVLWPLGAPAREGGYGPSPPHVSAFVVPPSPLVGFHSSQLAVRAAPQLQAAGARAVPAIFEAHPASAAAPRAAAATAASLAVAPGAAGGPLGLGGAGASALGGGLQRGLGAPLVPTLSSAVDDAILMAALELLAPPAPPPGGGGGAGRNERSTSETGGGAARGGGGGGEGEREAPSGSSGGGRGGVMVRSLSDVQGVEAPAALPEAARPRDVRRGGSGGAEKAA
jgi:hypothetical protein